MVSVENNSILKKISAVIVMITALVFFSFNVFADTPVQPLQVVTYSDTTTNVRISGTAERLHYNIDSFQVVFMNPPNNYGTSCTPVLVSFRFYNSSDLPAYVGQAEFELTATTSTGSVNTIIYGYDQISTDLFVAESSYSTAEVGRIGIGASNDFAYYTGFVIPPHTSLYFSCIVYVNASAYAQNNTGATEDVNQVTLSSLNLYTNQLSFSDDYPYHGEPIDFSTVIDAIDDLKDTVSTSTEMQSLIESITYTGTYYQFQDSNIARSNRTVNLTSGNNSVEVFASRVVNKSYLTLLETIEDSSNDTQIINGTIKIPVMYYIKITANQNSSFYQYYDITNALPYNNCVIHIESLTSNLFNAVESVDTKLRFYFKHLYGNNRSLVTTGVHYTILYGYIEVPINETLTWNNIDLGGSFYRDDNTYMPVDDYYILRDLYLAYSQVNGLDDSSDISNDVADVSNSNHIIEESYYSANASAIEATGLSNYRFSDEQNNGIGKVADDFMLLWNALGSWNGVYIFSLTMALATFIMRHGGLFTIKREVSDKGGDGE